MNRWLAVFLAVLTVATPIWADGLETFDNENASPTTYGNGSFVGNQGIGWNYTAARNATADSGAYKINGSGLIFKGDTTAAVASDSIPGGIRNFSMNLRKAFTGSGNRQVELFINGVSKGKSATFDDTNVHTFTVNNINVSGNVIIEVRNALPKQVTGTISHGPAWRAGTIQASLSPPPSILVKSRQAQRAPNRSPSPIRAYQTPST